MRNTGTKTGNNHKPPANNHKPAQTTSKTTTNHHRQPQTTRKWPQTTTNNHNPLANNHNGKQLWQTTTNHQKIPTIKIKPNKMFPNSNFFFFFNWDSLHARLNSHFKAWRYKKGSTKKITEYRKSV